MNNKVPIHSTVELRSEGDEELLRLIALRPENELLARAAFQVFYERYESYLFGLARKVCAQFPRSANELFEAVFQNTFMQVYLRAATFTVSRVKTADLSAGVKAWIGRIADNEHKLLLRQLRKESLIQLADDIPISDDELEAIPVEEQPDELESYQRTVLEQALATLSEVERYILIQSTAYEQEGKYLPSTFIDSTCKLWQITRVNFRKIKSIARRKVRTEIRQLLALQTN